MDLQTIAILKPLKDLNSDVKTSSGENRLHFTAELDNCDIVTETLAREPKHAGEFSKDGFTPRHLSCKAGHLEITKELVQSNRGLCSLKDKNGRSPLHAAAMKGIVEVTKLLLEDCPGSVNDVTATDKTCLHIAVVYNKFEVIQYLVKWLGERPDYADLVNQKDLGGNTVLHLAVARKQLQTLKVLLTCNPNISKLVTVNAMNRDGFTALDILDVLPYGGKIDMEIDKLLREAGGLKGRDIVSHDNNRRGCYHRQPSHLNSIKYILRPRKENAHYVLLVTATLLATITYHAIFSSPGIAKKGYEYHSDINGILQLKKPESVIKRSFILFNSTGFITSVALIIFLLHEFPLKPWPQIFISTFFGSYMCAIMAISPSDASVLLFLAIPLLLLAAMGKMFGFGRQRNYESSCEGDE